MYYVIRIVQYSRVSRFGTPYIHNIGRCPKYCGQTVPPLILPFLVVVKVSATDEPLGEDLGVGIQEDDGVGRADVGLKVARLLHVRRVAVDQEALQGKEKEDSRTMTLSITDVFCYCVMAVYFVFSTTDVCGYSDSS